jgi:hypothetical protein
MMFKAKAEAEKEKYQAQGLKAGEDFVDGKLLSAGPEASFFSPDLQRELPNSETRTCQFEMRRMAS